MSMSTVDSNSDHSIFLKILAILCIIFLAFLWRTWQKNDSFVRSIAIQTLPFFPDPKISPAPKKYISSILAANSRLGNHLFELSSLFGISRKLKRTPVFFIQNHYHETMLKETDFLIPGLLDNFLIVNGPIPASIFPTEFGMKCCIFDDPERLKNVTDEYLHLGGHHYHSWKYFARLRSKLMGFLKSPPPNFTNLPVSDDLNFITCIHIRRTDFAGTGFHMAGDDFILNSIKFVKREEHRKNENRTMSTVFFGDDFEFMKGLVNETKKWENLKIESFISSNSPTDDILYARHHCDTVMITSPHSTFGWWMGFLSKGNQVYYNDIRFTDDQSMVVGNFNPDDYFPPNWTPIKFDDFDNSSVVESLK